MRAKIKGGEGEEAAPARNRRGAHRGWRTAAATELGGGGNGGWERARVREGGVEDKAAALSWRIRASGGRARHGC